MERITDQHLQDLIDHKIPAARQRELMEQIEEDPELLRKFNLLQAVHSNLEGTTLQPASEKFSEKVMANLYNPQYVPEIISAPYTRRNLFTFLTIFAGILVGIYILSSGIISIPLFDQLNIQPLKLEGTEINFSPILDNITSSLIFKIFIMADIVLAWFLLDRMVLKPYFANRKKHMAY